MATISFSVRNARASSDVLLWVTPEKLGASKFRPTPARTNSTICSTVKPCAITRAAAHAIAARREQIEARVNALMT